MDIDRTAPVIVELSTTIAAPLGTLWPLHTDITAWPTWHSDITSARPRGDLAVGTVFDWQSHGLAISSTISELRPQERIVWGGHAHGIDGIHVWTFRPVDGGVLVSTLESWAGPAVDADPDGMRTALEGSLRAWLAALKQTAEQSTDS
ncbi:SRPBCC family protein [Kitasatospora sp. NBC_01266]|uniref:SRPBCC family protein n=1 Tax=Kitasatospora sp. NBC_01266 TaxID=2903572 RepID=UPI002E336AD9|nr:SRPBCC family protein [Kitasatospora sp. NBC_01266]